MNRRQRNRQNSNDHPKIPAAPDESGTHSPTHPPPSSNRAQGTTRDRQSPGSIPFWGWRHTIFSSVTQPILAIRPETGAGTKELRNRELPRKDRQRANTSKRGVPKKEGNIKNTAPMSRILFVRRAILTTARGARGRPGARKDSQAHPPPAKASPLSDRGKPPSHRQHSNHGAKCNAFFFNKGYARCADNRQDSTHSNYQKSEER